MAELLAKKDIRDEDLGLVAGASSRITVTSLAPTLQLAESEHSNTTSFAVGTFDFALSSDETYMIVTGIGEVGTKTIEIPAEFNDLPVREIAASAFEGTDIISVVIPNSIRKIGDLAFNNCSSLVSVTFEDSSTRVVYFDNSFAGFENVACTYWDSNGTKRSNTNPTLMGDDVYRFEIPSSVVGLFFFDILKLPSSQTEDITTNIANNVCWIADLPQVSASGSITYQVVTSDYTPDYTVGTNSGLSIGKSAFLNTGLTELTLPARLEKMEDYAFGDNKSLTTVTVTNKTRLTEISNGAFLSAGLVAVNLPNGIKEICSMAFNNCSSLKEVNIPLTVKKIGENAFGTCASLEKVTVAVGSNLEEIGYRAFSNCTLLKKFDIPSSVIKIGAYAFRGCSPLGVIIFEDCYTWFATQNASFTTDYTGGRLIKSTALDNPLTTSSALSGELAPYTLYKLKRMPKPTASISDYTLYMTDPLGVAEAFNIYVNNELRVTLYPSSSGTGSDEGTSEIPETGGSSGEDVSTDNPVPSDPIIETESLLGTWILNYELSLEAVSDDFDFTVEIEGSGEPETYNYTGMSCDSSELYYTDYPDESSNQLAYHCDAFWLDEGYRTINITSEPTDETFIAWLKANAFKEGAIANELLGTWVFNDDIPEDSASWDVEFTYDLYGSSSEVEGTEICTGMRIGTNETADGTGLFYTDGGNEWQVYDASASSPWECYDSGCQTITITNVSDDEGLLEWLKANAVKQEGKDTTTT